MRNRLLRRALAATTLASAAYAGTPTDNPVAAYYSGPEGYPAWTDLIAWSNVIDMSSYPRGKNDFEKFENARDELAAKGGGVLYYPGGAYDFRDLPATGPQGRGLMLRSGVVIRGEAPAGEIDPANGKLELKTRFLFPFEDRSKVAVDAGERARMFLKNAILWKGRKGETLSEGLYFSFGMKAGKLDPSDLIVCRGSLDVPATAKVTEAGDKLKIEATVEIGTANAPSKAAYVIELTRAAADLTGGFRGRVNDLDAKGEVAGRIFTVTPETPRDWNIIGLCPEKGKRLKDVNYVGICWVRLVGATVYFGPDVQWGPTWESAQSWKSNFVKKTWGARMPDGAHPMDPFCGGGKTYMGAGQGRLVFGCFFDQAVQLNDAMGCGVKHATAPDEAVFGFGADGFHMHKFGARVAAYGSRVLIAANVLARSEGRNFKHRQPTIRTHGVSNTITYGGMRENKVLFDYNYACGIDVNKDLLGLVRAEVLDPAQGKGYFEEGVLVRDNYVYNYGHKGFNVSGRWVAILNNRNERMVYREPLNPYLLHGWKLTLDGFSEVCGGGPGGVSDTLSRAFDLGGQHLWVDGNFYNNTGSAGNDGEGILCQSHGGTQIYSWAITRNRHEQGVGQAGYMGGWAVPAHGCLIAWNELPGWVGQAASSTELDCAYIANKAGKVSVGKGGTALTQPPEGRPSAPGDVKAQPYGKDAVKITWTDTAANEIGFRVQRSLDGGRNWATLAYRPPQIQAAPANPPAWADFNLPPGKPAIYRVVAVNADDKDDGASAPTAPITLAPLR
jgi:hypothetical protein